jgi:hypothetical protein
MSDTEKKVREDENQEISEKDMESVSGGVIEGGCVIYPPIIKRPTIPTTTTL